MSYKPVKRNAPLHEIVVASAGFSAGFNSMRPIPPLKYSVGQCILWGDAYIKGKRSRRKSLSDALENYLENL